EGEKRLALPEQRFHLEPLTAPKSERDHVETARHLRDLFAREPAPIDGATARVVQILPLRHLLPPAPVGFRSVRRHRTLALRAYVQRAIERGYQNVDAQNS